MCIINACIHKSQTPTAYLTKITAAQNEVTLSYHRVRGLYFLAVIFTATIRYSKVTTVTPSLQNSNTTQKSRCTDHYIHCTLYIRPDIIMYGYTI